LENEVNTKFDRQNIISSVALRRSTWQQEEFLNTAADTFSSTFTNFEQKNRSAD
jgi:hypothetical protein